MQPQHDSDMDGSVIDTATHFSLAQTDVGQTLVRKFWVKLSSILTAYLSTYTTLAYQLAYTYIM
jgi:hypothetical protein